MSGPGRRLTSLPGILAGLAAVWIALSPWLGRASFVAGALLALSAFLVYVGQNAPARHRRHGSYLAEQAIDHMNGISGRHHPDEPVDLPPAPARRRSRVGRNRPCPCGSGIKFKRCCGEEA